MLFDFHAFIDELRQKDEKKQIVEKYEKICGPIQWNLKDQARYTEYASKFVPMKYLTPDELKDDFDWDLLLQLVISSFSSDYELKAKDTDKKNEDNNDELRDLYIAVKSGDQSVVKTVSELWSFQILRLYEIYIEEQMNLHALMSEDEKEKTAIQAEREMRLKKWEAVLDTLDRGKEADKAKKDQASKLDDLMGKL